jgi:hypothetical protein
VGSFFPITPGWAKRQALTKFQLKSTRLSTQDLSIKVLMGGKKQTSFLEEENK